MQRRVVILQFTVIVLLLQRISFIQTVKPYQMTFEIFDNSAGRTCQKHEFRTIKGSYSGYIYSHDPKSETYRPYIQCFLSIEVPEGYQVVLEAVEFNLGYPPSSMKCQSDSLFIFDNQPENGKIFDSDPNMLGEFCGIDNRTILATSSKNSITLYWHAGAPEKRYANAKGFVLKWSVQRKILDRNQMIGSCDNTKEFTCSNQQTCIPLELACDDVSHCLDGSDLIKSRQISAGCDNVASEPQLFADLSGAAIAGIILACILISVLTMVIFICCCISSRRRNSQASRNNLNYQPAPTTATPVGSNNSNGVITPMPTQLSSSSNNSYNNKNNCYNNTKSNNYNNHYLHHQYGNGTAGTQYNVNNHHHHHQHQHHLYNPNEVV